MLVAKVARVLPIKPAPDSCAAVKRQGLCNMDIALRGCPMTCEAPCSKATRAEHVKLLAAKPVEVDFDNGFDVRIDTPFGGVEAGTSGVSVQIDTPIMEAEFGVDFEDGVNFHGSYDTPVSSGSFELGTSGINVQWETNVMGIAGTVARMPSTVTHRALPMFSIDSYYGGCADSAYVGVFAALCCSFRFWSGGRMQFQGRLSC